MQLKEYKMVKNVKANRVLAENYDKVIAQRIKTVREQKRLTQKDVANAIGVSFQQFQKYENGINRVSGGNLRVIANSLGVSVDYFFVGQDNNIQYSVAGLADSEKQEPFNLDDSNKAKKPNSFIDQLLAMAYTIKDANVQGDILAVIKTLIERKK